MSSYLLHSLASNKRVQDKLRAEIYDLGFTLDNNMTINDISSLPYLDLVIKEATRLNAPVPLTIREAIQDDVSWSMFLKIPHIKVIYR